MDNQKPPPVNDQPQSDVAVEPNPVVSEAPVSAVITEGQKRRYEVKESVRLIGLVVAVTACVWLTLSYIVTPVLVNGISMHPTFYTGDIVLLWKFPETWADITNGQYIPNRGNIVVIKKTPVSGEDLIKRVVGLPGETITINGGTVTIYNAQYPNGFDPDKLYFKTVPYTAGQVDSQIGPGNIFVMGDNRAPGASIDSRSSIGTIPPGGIEGRVLMRVFPFNKISLF